MYWTVVYCSLAWEQYIDSWKKTAEYIELDGMEHKGSDRIYRL
jgi:hypothetical protein